MKIVYNPGALFKHANGAVSIAVGPARGNNIQLRLIDDTGHAGWGDASTYHYSVNTGRWIGGGEGHPLHVVGEIKP